MWQLAMRHWPLLALLAAADDLGTREDRQREGGTGQLCTWTIRFVSCFPVVASFPSRFWAPLVFSHVHQCNSGAAVTTVRAARAAEQESSFEMAEAFQQFTSWCAEAMERRDRVHADSVCAKNFESRFSTSVK